jgi:uncharacterized protein YlaI
MNIKPIETEYKGYRFRSRLEARWAVFFDAVGIKYEYEKEGFDLGEYGYYLPDFWFPELNVWAEVKGQDFTDDEENKVKALSEVKTYFCGYCDNSHGVIKLIGIPDYGYINGYFNTINGPYNNNFLFICSSNQNYPVKPGFYSDLTASVIFPAHLSKREIDNQIRESKKLYNKGIKAAKSARFEHGEKPTINPHSNDYVLKTSNATPGAYITINPHSNEYVPRTNLKIDAIKRMLDETLDTNERFASAYEADLTPEAFVIFLTELEKTQIKKTIIKKFMEHEKQITPEAVNLILDDLILKSESPNEYIDKLLSKFSLFDFVINAERVNSILN